MTSIFGLLPDLGVGIWVCSTFQSQKGKFSIQQSGLFRRLPYPVERANLKKKKCRRYYTLSY